VADIASKSISVEETYEEDLDTPDVIETALLAHAQRLSGRLRRSGLRARTITLKIRYSDFTTLTRTQTVASALDGARYLFGVAVALFRGLDHDVRPVRLLGLSGSSLEPADAPAQLDIDSDVEWERMEDAVADVRERFGETAVGPARLLGGRKPTESEPEP
jgi:DNA polymerase-4